MDQMINKWIDEYPEKGNENAEELVKFIREHEKLKI